jgi:hypothetical protein
MNRQQLDDSIEKIAEIHRKVLNSETEIYLIDANSHQVNLPVGLYAGILDLLLFILEFLREEGTRPDGTPKKYRWYDFLLKASLRNFVGRLLSYVLDLVKNVFVNPNK